MQQIQKMAFTSEYNGKSRFLKNEASICYGNSSANAITLWDTGASSTVISKSIVDQLNLIPTGKMSIQTPSGTDVVNTYLVDIIALVLHLYSVFCLTIFLINQNTIGCLAKMT